MFERDISTDGKTTKEGSSKNWQEIPYIHRHHSQHAGWTLVGASQIWNKERTASMQHQQ